MNTKITRLSPFPVTNQYHRFAALWCPAVIADDQVYILTPWVMKWSDHIYLSDLNACQQYWQTQAKQYNLSLTLFFEKLMQQMYKNQWLLVLGHHPWPCLCLLHYLTSAGLTGIHTTDSSLGKRIYRNISWDHWFFHTKTLAQHLVNTKTKRFRFSQFSGKLSQLKRFIKRTHISGPFGLKHAHAVAIERRFSGWVGQLWRWTFRDYQNINDLDRFPWISYQPPESPKVHRDLEYPLNLWQTIEPLLVEDIQKLGRQFHHQDHVIRMVWSLNLYHGQSLNMDIVFRHPYHMHRDAPQFETACYQCRYAFTHTLERLRQRDHHLDLPPDIPILSWTITIADKIVRTPQMLSLFPDMETNIQLKRIMALQNKLILPIEQYALIPSFVPEHSFTHSHAAGQTDLSMQPWIDAAMYRPFFFHQPVVMDPPNPKHLEFLERVSALWWEQSNEYRDYYRLKHMQQYLWVFRNHLGIWYRHGIFD